MNPLRIVPADAIPLALPCSRCERIEGCWDRIAGKAYCPHCQEMLVMGEGEPLIEQTEENRCAVCSRLGTVCFHSFPLQAVRPVAIDLCPAHLRHLLGRCLGSYAYHQLRRQLNLIGIPSENLFLLHSAFYDDQGHALQPARVV
ncbi:MAG TPA: hypothetical protein VGY77_12440 [Gemmataceae bacterium]|nr:hypothetical protein [Gemmataceae bacterium]